jgi:hypothetical protein
LRFNSNLKLNLKNRKLAVEEEASEENANEEQTTD